MKARPQVILFTVLLLTALLVSAAFAGPVATVQSASGASLRRAAAAGFATLGGRTPLNAGDVVRTGAKGKASLLFLDGSQLRLGASTTVEITSATSSGSGRQSFFRALGGQVWARMRPGSAARTRTAVAGVRGTEILLQVAEDGTSTLTVIEGSVDYYNEFGGVVVNQSQQSVAAPGKAPTSPITVDNPGLLIEWTFDLDFVVMPREKFWVSQDAKTLQVEEAKRKAAAGNDAAAQRAYGDVLFDQREFGAALAAYDAARKLNPADRLTALRLGWALLELGRLDEAEAQLRFAAEGGAAPAVQLVAADAENDAENIALQAYVGLAWLELARNRAGEARKYAQKAEELPEAGIVLGVSLLRLNELDGAQLALTAAGKALPDGQRSQAKAWLALVLLARGDTDGALKVAREAATEAPYSGLARGNLSLALLFSDQEREAAKQGRRAVELNPDAVAARVALAQALLVKGDSDDASREAAIAVGLDPESPQAYYILGLADAARRDYVHAERELKESLKLAPDFLPAAAALARVQTAMGRKQEATTLLTQFQAKYPQSPDVYAAMGQIHYQQGNYREAAAQYEKAVALQPKSALYQAEWARLLLDDNQLNAALKAAQQAVFLAPQVGQYHALLGLVAEFSGLQAYASREYRVAIALDPQNALARARLAIRDANPRVGVNTITQAFLYDPAISRQLFRGGVDAELTLSAGNDGARGVAFGHRAQTDDGKVYVFGSSGYNRSDGADRAPNDSTSGSVVQEYVNYVPDAKTNILGQVVYTSSSRGYNGFTGTFDDRNDLFGKRAALGMRRRFGDNHHLWLGGIYDVLWGDVRDPNSDSNLFDVFPGPLIVLTERERSITRTGELDSRLDFNLNDNPNRRSIFSLGASYASSRSKTTQNLTLLPPLPGPAAPIGDNVNDLTRRSTLTYAQLSQRVNSKLSFIAQLRRQDITGTFSTNFIGLPLIPVEFDESRALPSLLVNYQLNNKTALRFFAHRRQQDIGYETFAPTETLLSSEDTILPAGFSSNIRVYELDVERYFSPTTFGKLFAFKTDARNMILGDNFLGRLDVPRIKKKGVGVRFEQQLNKNLFASLLYVMNRTEAEAPGTLFDGETAPYQPRRVGRFALNYVDARGNKASAIINHAGGFYQDSPVFGGRPRFPSRTTLDLVLRREPSLRHEFTFAVINVFDKNLILFNGFPAAGRQYQVSYTCRF